MARIVTVRIRVPEWVSDEDVERIAREIERRLERTVLINVLRKMMKVREEELVDRLEPVDWRELEGREREKL